MKKTLFTLVTLVTSLTFANSCSPCDPCEPCPCPEFTPCPPPSTCAYNAPHGIDLLCQWDVFVTGSFIWWEAKQDNLELGSVVTTSGSTSGLDRVEETNRQLMNFDYEPGFKIGLGMNFDCDNWQIYGEYTYLRPSNSSSFVMPKAENGQTISFDTPWWVFNADPIIGNGTTNVSSKWDLGFDMLDLELAREYYVGRCLTFRSFGGLKAAWIRQTYDMTITQDNSGAGGPASRVYNLKAKTENWGVGPRVGVNADWIFCDGFRIFTNSAFSILYTKYTTDSAPATIVDNEVNSANSSYQTSDDTCSLKPEADITIGLGWGDYFFCNKWYFDLEIGYNFMVFWDQNQFHTDTLTLTGINSVQNNGGNLVMHGLTVTARLDF